MKTYGRVEVYTHGFVTSALEGGECLALRPDYFTPGKRAPGTHWIVGWMGPSAGMDAEAKRKNLFPDPASNRTPLAYSRC
jgi:hypothetical protein